MIYNGPGHYDDDIMTLILISVISKEGFSYYLLPQSHCCYTGQNAGPKTIFKYYKFLFFVCDICIVFKA